MEKKTKAQTFMGFILRSNKYRVGTNSVASLKKANLIIVCHTAAENTKKECISISKKFHCPLLQTAKKPLEEMILRENAKVMAVTDKALATALKDNVGEDFISVNQEN